MPLRPVHSARHHATDSSEKCVARLERFSFEKGETRGGAARPAQSERKNCAFSTKQQAVWFGMRSIAN